jgi:hypothetical protein
LENPQNPLPLKNRIVPKKTSPSIRVADFASFFKENFNIRRKNHEMIYS